MQPPAPLPSPPWFLRACVHDFEYRDHRNFPGSSLYKADLLFLEEGKCPLTNDLLFYSKMCFSGTHIYQRSKLF